MTAEKKVKWTDQQRKAILARGGNVFVTASAGTGKTAVLSGRCVSLVSDVSACPEVLNMLVLTFTEAAAEQMHARIAQQLREAYQQTRDVRLFRQLVLLQGANISTIHSFCKRLITEHFHRLSLDPSFRVIDGDEAMLLKGETLEETIEWAWRQNHLVPGLNELLHRRDVRGSDGFLGSVIRLSDFLEGVVGPERWCDRAQWLAEQVDPLNSELGTKQQQMIKDRLATILAQLRVAKTLYEDEVPDGGWGAGVQKNLIEPITTCLDRLKANDWAACANGIRNFRKPRLATPRGLPEMTAKVIADLQRTAVGAFLKLNDLALLNPDYLNVVGRSTSLQTRILIELTRQFNHLYARRKSRLNGLDFADLERYALKLLTVTDPSGERLRPSETALALRSRFKYIFVDEYQDINPVQQAILDALSSGNNVFVVGDVKQSIYAWRGAEPAIFLQRLHSASSTPKDMVLDLRVDLNYNFRSIKGILDFVNKVFGRIMTHEIAHINYDEAARLRPAPEGEMTDSGQPIVELHILDERDGRSTQDEEDIQGRASVPARQQRSCGDARSTTTGGSVKAEGLGDGSLVSEDRHRQAALDAATPHQLQAEGLALVGPRQRQAARIARRIREMVGAQTGRAEFQVLDKHTGALRNVEYRDIVVLMRSLARKANDYVEILRLAGIPVNCDATAGYFEATEVRDVLSLLKVLDNPQRDIELATVLRSAFFHLTDTDLVKIRMHGREKAKRANFHQCAAWYQEDGPDGKLREKLKTVFERLQRWRSLARRGQLAAVIWRIYRQSGLGSPTRKNALGVPFLAFVSALPNGQARKANLLRLHDRAVQFEGFASNTGVASLTRFVDFLERLQEAGQDWAPAQPGSAAGNAVRILSVHKSKGLEFPVVFLAELETEFNKRDTYADLIADADDAVGLQVIDHRSNTRLRSLAHEVISEKKQAASLAEEMRVLYVATTRARDRLILTASQKRTDCGRTLANGLLLGGETVPAWLLKPCKNALEWVLYGLCDQRVLHEAFRTGLADRAQDQGLFRFQLHGGDELEDLSRFVMTLRASKAKSAFFMRKKSPSEPDGRKLLAQVKSNLSRAYPFAYAIDLAAKSSVTKLTHHDDIFVQRDYSEALDRRPLALVSSGSEMCGSRLARQVGTATHLVVSSLDLKRPVTREVVEKTRERLVHEGAIPVNIADSVDIEAILAFFETRLGAVVCDRRNPAWQEWPFTFGLPAGEAVRSMGVSPMSGFPNAIYRVWGPSSTAVPAVSTTGILPVAMQGQDAPDTHGRDAHATETPHGVATSGNEIVVVQGVIDLLAQTPQGLVVIDFKTDHVSGDEIGARAQTYHGQLELYARAAAHIRRDKVLEKWLYFFTPRQGVQV
jgi:ATP-dependent helicase/nuclease subunit A